jgi:catechol 2,3-dioxygenase-like lactoylglutathione lyase family enzyme
MPEAVFRKIDCHMLRAPDLDAAIAFYRDRLGQKLVWKTDIAAGFAMPDTDAELVVHTTLAPETDLLVESVPEAFEKLIGAGASAIMPPFEIAIRKCAVLRDPFGNVLTILDQSKGPLQVDESGNVLEREEVKHP